MECQETSQKCGLSLLEEEKIPTSSFSSEVHQTPWFKNDQTELKRLEMVEIQWRFSYVQGVQEIFERA